jgi:hypothetical protein
MNAPFRMPTQHAPDITLSGETVEQMLMLLSNATIFARTPDGSMRPFVDPQPIVQILGAALQAAAPPGGQNGVAAACQTS